eukprot:12125449-Alexandrium_andersonii.AAC.1
MQSTIFEKSAKGEIVTSHEPSRPASEHIQERGTPAKRAKAAASSDMDIADRGIAEQKGPLAL